MEAHLNAMTNRSLRTIKAELEFLADSSLITTQQLTAFLSQLPAESTIGRRGQSLPTPAATPVPVAAMNTLNLNGSQNGYSNEKSGYYSPSPQNAAPPAYPSAPAPPSAPPLTHATALYQYNATDAGDLSIQPNDRVAVTEYMNAEWWKGKNERTGQEGIFPRSYVRVEDKGLASNAQSTSYGNMPLDVSNGAQQGPAGAEKQPGKGQEMGKKFGKKLGNAAVFGAGATIGSNIVNSIF